MLTPVLTYGGQLRQGDQLRKRERRTGHAAVLMGTHQHLEQKKIPVKRANLRDCDILGCWDEMMNTGSDSDKLLHIFVQYLLFLPTSFLMY